MTWTNESLNEPQRRHLRESLAQLERHMNAIAAILEQAHAPGLFPRYADDMTAAEHKALEARLARARAALEAAAAACELQPEAAGLGAKQAVQAQWSVAEVGLDDLLPTSMRAYGPVGPEVAAELEAIAARLRSALAKEGDTKPAATPELSAALQAAVPEAMAAMAEALADAAQARAANDELPLIATDALTRVAHRVARTHGAREPLPAIDIRAIPWRLDTPGFAGLGRNWARQRFARQLEPLRAQIQAALQSFAARVK